MNYVRAQNLIDRGRGKAALRLGQPHDVYRIQNNGAVNYLDLVNQIVQGELILRRPSQATKDIEGTRVTAIAWEVIGNFGLYQLGDVFVQNDPIFGAGQTLVESGFYPPNQSKFAEIEAFCLAWHGPVKKSIGIRLDNLCTIWRPLQGGTDSNGYFSADVNIGQPLVLQSGMFSFQPNGATPATVLCGTSSHIRAHQDLYKGLPSSTATPLYLMYIPPLPGYEIREADRIILNGGDRYVVQVPFEQEAGMVGNQAVCTREVSNP